MIAKKSKGIGSMLDQRMRDRKTWDRMMQQERRAQTGCSSTE